MFYIENKNKKVCLWVVKLKCCEDYFINWKCDGKFRDIGYIWVCL